MKKYDITAIGNALVDLEYQVDSEFFTHNDIEKGVMTLIDKERHSQLLSILQEKYTLAKKAGGGSAANTVVTAAQYGAKTFYCCKVGDDDFGTFYKQDLLESGVSHALKEQNDSGETGKCVVMVTDDADRTMNTFLGITETLGMEQVVEEAIADSKYFYIEGHLMYSDDAVEAILYAKKIARESGVKVAATVSDPAVVKYVKPNLQKILGDDGVDVLFCNAEEATDFGDGSIDRGVEEFRKHAKLLVVTEGENGATIYCKELGKLHVDPHTVNAVDTTGAGDTFAGAYLYGLIHGLSAQKSGELANRTAAECVASFGPRLSKATQDAIFKELNS